MNTYIKKGVLLLSGLTIFTISAAFAMGEKAISAKDPIDRQPDTNGHYHLLYEPEPNSDDYAAQAEIFGEDCSNLMGKLYPPSKKGMWHEGKFYCLPYIGDIKKYIRYSDAYITENEVVFKGGPILLKLEKAGLSRDGLYQSIINNELNMDRDTQAKLAKEIQNIPRDAKIVGRHFYKVKSIQACGNEDNLFCATIDHYDPAPKLSKNFRVFCWDCEGLKSSPDKLQESILFYRSGYGLLLKGGIAFEFDQTADRLIPRLKRVLTSTERGSNE